MAGPRGFVDTRRGDFAPHVFLDHATTEGTIGPLHQVVEEGELLGRELQWHSGTPGLSRGRVQNEIAVPQPGLGVKLLDAAAERPEQGRQATPVATAVTSALAEYIQLQGKNAPAV